MEKKYVPAGVFLSCDKGVTPSPLSVTFNANAVIYGQNLATEADKVPLVNVRPMGVCTVTKGPCVPAPLLWNPVQNDVLVGNHRLLLEDSKLPCSLGGRISIFFTLAEAMAAAAPAPPPEKSLLDQADDYLATLGPAGDYARFQMGMAEGLYAGGKSMVEGLWGLAKGGWHAATHPVETATAIGDAASSAAAWASQGENWRNAASAAGEGLGAAADWASHGENWGKAWDGASDWASQQSPRDWGKIGGRATFEVAMAVGTGGAGTAANVAGKAGEAANLLSKAGEAANLADKGLDAARLAERAAELAALAEKAGEAGNAAGKAGVVGKVTTGAEEAADAARAAKAAEEARAAARAQTYEELAQKPPCFLAGTLVHTPAGPRAIEQLAAGELVWAYDFDNDIAVARPIVGVMRNWTRFVVSLTLAGDVVRTTREHRFWVPDAQAWMAAAELQEGMQLLTRDGQALRLEAHRVYEAEADTYNFEVAELHNYFVGAGGALVHNAKQPKPFVPSAKFSSTVKTPTKIYTVTDPKTGEVKYVGQTIHPTVDQRMAEHLEHPNKAHWEPDNYKIREVKSGNWTPYEASVWEQHYIDKNGGKAKLENARDEITKKKYDIYKDPKYGHNPCP
jgi:hypothetical protein